MIRDNCGGDQITRGKFFHENAIGMALNHSPMVTDRRV